MSGCQRRMKGRKEPEYISAKLENINGKQEMTPMPPKHPSDSYITGCTMCGQSSKPAWRKCLLMVYSRRMFVKLWNHWCWQSQINNEQIVISCCFLSTKSQCLKFCMKAISHLRLCCCTEYGNTAVIICSTALLNYAHFLLLVYTDTLLIYCFSQGHFMTEVQIHRYVVYMHFWGGFNTF